MFALFTWAILIYFFGKISIVAAIDTYKRNQHPINKARFKERCKKPESFYRDSWWFTNEQ